MVEIPLYGKIAAGTPIEAIANESERFSVPYDMVSRGQYYALTVEGDSMVNIGIMDGDTVIIKKPIPPTMVILLLPWWMKAKQP